MQSKFVEFVEQNWPSAKDLEIPDPKQAKVLISRDSRRLVFEGASVLHISVLELPERVLPVTLTPIPDHGDVPYWDESLDWRDFIFLSEFRQLWHNMVDVAFPVDDAVKAARR